MSSSKAKYAAIVHPDFYAPRNGMPLHWSMIDKLVLDVQDHYPPDIAKCVTAFMRHHAKRTVELTRPEFEAIKAYLVHYVMAPIWDAAEMSDHIRPLRESIFDVETMGELDLWLSTAMSLGVDPFSPATDEEIREIRASALGVSVN